MNFKNLTRYIYDDMMTNDDVMPNSDNGRVKS